MSTPAEPIRRVVVFTSDPNHSVRHGIGLLLAAYDDLEFLVLVHAPSRTAGRLIRNQFRNLRRHGPAWIPYQGKEMASRIGEALTRRQRPRRHGSVGARYARENLEATGRVRFETLPSVNGTQAQDAVRAFGADLGIALAAPILRKAVFEIPRLGTINLHKGKLPEYRGMPPAFWELQDGCSEVGCTIHEVRARLDAGPILLEASLPVEEYSTAAGLRVGLDRLGNELLVAAVGQLRSGTATPRAQSEAGARTNTRPRLSLEAQARREAARKEGTTSLRQKAKDSVFRGYSGARAALRAVRFIDREPRVVVLLYHRVSDEFRDNVTIGVERFDDQMSYLADHYEVVALRDLVRGDVVPEPGRRLVCITFDDGYKDNSDNAAPILIKHGLPATFFLSTDKIENQTAFQHDLDKLGRGLRNMSWDEVRSMQSDGLDFGSHTVNHANLAQLSPEEIERELVESREALRRELGQSEFLFAYPFGGRDDITPEARQQVMASGYSCCCSAYGGINVGKLQLDNILRIGVNYNISMPALRARIDGWAASATYRY